jgi:hypothetical protein
LNRVSQTVKKFPNLCALVIGFLLFALFYGKVLWNGNVFVFVDASRFFYPLWKWGAVDLNQGIIPLWNSDAQLGTPYLADPQMACAYPPVFLFYSWWSPINVFSALILFHHFWAVIGFWIYAREQGYSWKASLWGSLVFGFSLHLVCSSWTPVAMMTISWLPWVFLSAEKIYQRKSGGFFLLSICWAMQLSAGYPVLTYLTGLALLGHFGWKSFWDSEKNKFLNWLGWMGLAAFIAAVYNLIWGLPFLEFLKNSNYQNGSKRVQDLGWENLGTFFNPFISGDPLAGNYHGPHYWVATYFVGLPTLCFFIWGLTLRIYRKNTPWLLGLFLVLSLGSTLKLGDGLKRIVPGYALVIHSGFWISLVILWLVVLSMEALDVFIAPSQNRGRDFGWPIIVSAVYGTALGLQNPSFSAFFWLSFLLVLGSFWIEDKNLKWAAVLAALSLSLGPAAYSLNITMDRVYYEKPPVLLSRLTHSGRFFFSPVLLGDAVRLQGQNMDDAYEGAKQSIYPNWPLAFGREEVPIYNTLQLDDSFAWTYQVFRQSLNQSRKALNFLGIRYVFGPSHFSDLKEIAQPPGAVKVFENLNSMPRWFSLSTAVAAGADTGEDFVKADLNHFDFARTGFVENASSAGSYHNRKVTELNRTPNSVQLSALGKGRAFIASSETESPGWKVWVNGKEKPVEKMNHAFRAVVLEDGEERAAFKYEPLSFRLGLFCSLLICGLWLGLLTLKRSREN